MPPPDTVETPKPKEGYIARLYRISTTDRFWNDRSHFLICGGIQQFFQFGTPHGGWFDWRQSTVIAIWTYFFYEAASVLSKWPEPDMVDGIPDMVTAGGGAMVSALLSLLAAALVSLFL